MRADHFTQTNLFLRPDFYSRLNSPFADGQSIRLPLSGLRFAHGVRQRRLFFLALVAIIANSSAQAESLSFHLNEYSRAKQARTNLRIEQEFVTQTCILGGGGNQRES